MRFTRVWLCWLFVLAVTGCRQIDQEDVPDDVQEEIVAEAVNNRDAIVAEAVNAAIEECEQEAESALDDFQSCLQIQSDSGLQDALLLCNPTPPDCGRW